MMPGMIDEQQHELSSQSINDDNANPTFARGYTIYISAPPAATEEGLLLKQSSDEITQKYPTPSDELIPPFDDASDPSVPRSRTESRFPSLDEVTHDEELREWLGTIGAHVDVEAALNISDAEMKCAALNKLVEKSRSDDEWTISLANDFPSLGVIVQWIRRLHQTALLTSKQSFGSTAQITPNSCEKTDHYTTANSLASLSVIFSLLRNVITSGERCAVYLADAGLHDAILQNVKDLSSLVKIADRHEWQIEPIDALPKSLLAVLINMTTNRDAAQRIWMSNDIHFALLDLSALVPGDADIMFQFLHNLFVKMSDNELLRYAPAMWRRRSDVNFPLQDIVITYFDKVRRLTKPCESTTERQSRQHRDDMLEWPLIFSCTFWTRFNGEILPYMTSRILWHWDDGDTLSRMDNTASKYALIVCIFRYWEEVIDDEQKELLKRHNRPTGDIATTDDEPISHRLLNLGASVYKTAFHKMYLGLFNMSLQMLSRQYDIQLTTNVTTTATTTTSVVLESWIGRTHVDEAAFCVETSGSTSPSTHVDEAAFCVETSGSTSPSIGTTTGTTDTGGEDTNIHFTDVIILFKTIIKILILVASSKTMTSLKDYPELLRVDDFTTSCSIPLLDMCLVILRRLASMRFDCTSNKGRKSDGTDNMDTEKTQHYAAVCVAIPVCDILLLMGNLMHNDLLAQDHIADVAGGLESLLSFMHIDDLTPYTREATIVAIRYATSNHQRNKDRIKQLLFSDPYKSLAGVSGGLEECLSQ